ncbi:MAG: lysylphosphatidylglycerol synthase transmembrane domain-containing protein, partial [Phycisphaerae bacterium]
MPGHGRRVWLSRLVRLGVCLLAVAWLYRATDWQEIRNTLANVNWRIALLGLLVFGPAPVLIGVRLKWLLAVHDIHLSIWKALKFTFVSNFLIHALPLGTSGGDALKAWYVARETPHKHEAVTTVFIDRVVGVVGLVLLSGLMVVINWNNPAMASWGEAALAKPWM